MKKYVIALITILLCCVLIVGFSLPDRIQYVFNGMAGYDLDDYIKTHSKLQEKDLNINFSTYSKKSIIIYKHSEMVYIELDSIVYNGDSYTFTFVSYGKSSFNEGEIICFEDNNEDTYITNDIGDFIFQYKGNSALENDRIEYYYDLYPTKEEINKNELTAMTITVPIKQMVLISYERI